MYDCVTKKLFGNQGTGSFVLGPDVAKPVMGLHFFKPAKPTARDYVQDGLIAMWDGIENAGWDVHDANATTWKDLIGNNDLALRSSATFSNDRLLNNSASNSATNNRIGIEGINTIEIGFVAKNSNAVILSVGNGLYVYHGNGRLWCNGTSGNSRPSICNYTQGREVHMSFLTNGTDRYVTRAYSDGEEVTSIGNKDYWNTGSVLAIGGYYNNVLNYRSLDGSVMYVRLYTSVLSAAEITHNYAVDKTRFNLP